MGKRSYGGKLKFVGFIGSISIIIFISFIFPFSFQSVPKGVKQFIQPPNEDMYMGKEELFSDAVDGQEEMIYGKKLAEYERNGYEDYEGNDIVIEGSRFTVSSANIEISTILGRSAVITNGENDWVEWEFTVPHTALYHIEIAYIVLEGGLSGAERGFTVDGTAPFAEAGRILFTRMWRDSKEIRRDNQGNELRPEQSEMINWQIKPLEHPEGFYKKPYKIYLPAGKHTLRFNDIKEPMAVSELRLTQPTSYPAYAEVYAGYDKMELAESGDPFIKVQMERPLHKSDYSLRAEFVDEALTEPNGGGTVHFNVFGGQRWSKGGQSAIWEFEVPQEGLYKIGFRYATPQSTDTLGSSKASYRTIRIDGEIPFLEMEEYTFPYGGGWWLEPLKDENNKPFLFFLEKGKHAITITAKVGPLRNSVQQLKQVMNEINILIRQVIQVTASTRDVNGDIISDRNQDWDLELHIPGLMDRLTLIRDTLLFQKNAVTQANGTPPFQILSVFSSTVHLIEAFIKDTEVIPRKLNELSQKQRALGQATESLSLQPLYLDYMAISMPEYAYSRSTATFWENMRITLANFIRSFQADTDNVGNIYAKQPSGNSPVLEVWVARGREWAEILKEMIDSDFTPKYGIKVNVNTVPVNSEHLLLLAYTAGNAPDAALGIAPQVPVDFAIRNALIDLNRFRDIEQTTNRFVSASLIPYRHQNGLYAIPETQDFMMMFVRTDIMEKLGINPPQTWQEVYAAMPKLHEKGMDFYYFDGVGGFGPFLFQQGGDFYSQDGLSSALDTPEALAAFTEWTNLSTYYKLPLKADFLQRFRTGEMPIGIGSYDIYAKLKAAAPELNGKWTMLPLPGVRNGEGTVNRSSGGSGQAAMILSSTQYPQEAWELLKWWTSQEVQIRYGFEIETVLGAGSRWNTANIEAMKNTVWSKDEVSHIMEQWSWFKEQPVVIGGYFTSRHLLNAWNRTVLISESPRIALEDAVTEINRELRRKQAEFGENPQDSEQKEGVLPWPGD